MSDAPPPLWPATTADGSGSASPLTPDRIDAVLAEFRGWLSDAAREEPRPEEPEPVDLFTLVAQFTALRHEVNLQTKASRTAVEQSAETLKRLTEATKPADPTELQRPLVKALIDIADALLTAVKQLERSKASFEPLLNEAEATEFPPPPSTSGKPGFFARLFGASDESSRADWLREVETAQQARADCLAATHDVLQPLVAGITDGYALSLRRVERALTQAGVEAIECEGQPFDPELMEVVEAMSGEGWPSGTVVEETRRGYRWNGTLLRFAQVKVAR